MLSSARSGSSGPYPRVSDIISCTNRRRSSGVTVTSSRWRIWSRALFTSTASSSADRPPIRGATSSSTSSRTFFLVASHELVALGRPLARVRFTTPAAGGGAGAASAASRVSSSSRAASFSDSFIVASWLGLGLAAEQALLLRCGVSGDPRLHVGRQHELHPGGHQAADLGGGRGGHDRHAEVDGPAHLLGVR